MYVVTKVDIVGEVSFGVVPARKSERIVVSSRVQNDFANNIKG